jgi:hypothetical protein
MTPKSKTILQWVVTIVASLGGLAVIGMAAQFWIATEVAAQLGSVAIPDTGPIATDVATMKTSIGNIETNVNRALESQQRFEEIFMEYLRDEANR